MPALSTYAQWTAAFACFEAGDDNVLNDMNDGQFVLDAGVAQRFYNRAEEAYRMRKQKWLDRFNRDMGASHLRSAAELGIVLQQAKAGLGPLARFVAAQGLPEHLKEALSKDLDVFVCEIKKSLKTNIDKKIQGREELLMQLNTFCLLGVVHIESAMHGPVTGRKIIF